MFQERRKMKCTKSRYIYCASYLKNENNVKMMSTIHAKKQQFMKEYFGLLNSMLYS